MTEVTLIRGDATERWPLPDNSLDSIVTDPPYGIAFMGKEWDDKGGPQAYQEWTARWASEAFRCLKPGGFLLAFGATRMVHRMACGFEDAGFRIVDTIEWLYLTGFPKAQDIGKLFDKKAGAEREVIAENPYNAVRGVSKGTAWAENGIRTMQGKSYITAPATPLAKKWDGWKTPNLKPAHEPIIMAQKPFSGTYIDNIERWGVGAINVDGCRVPHTPENEGNWGGRNKSRSRSVYGTFADEDGETPCSARHPLGRFPANVVLAHGPFCTEGSCMDGCPVKVLDEQSGGGSTVFAKFFYEEADFVPFYYCPKPSAKERNAGCEAIPERLASSMPGRRNPDDMAGYKVDHDVTQRFATRKSNTHPTVKPIKLVRYLQRLVTPPGGLAASPFLGSGTDAVAAILEGFNFWGMEIAEEYWPIIEARVAWAREQVKKEASRPVIEQARLSL